MSPQKDANIIFVIFTVTLKMKALLIEYSQKSTIAGLHYAFKQKQSMIGRVLWMISLAILTFLGFGLSLKNYNQWKEEPVLTTITTTG
jgi:hypothetical protein